MAQIFTEQLVLETAVADFFAVLFSPVRLAVLRLLGDGERCVTELVDALGIAPPRLSNHLACLRMCGFVTTRRGTFLYYARIGELLQLGEILAAPSESALATCAVLRGEQQRNTEEGSGC